MKKLMSAPVWAALVWVAYLAYEFLYVQPWIARTRGPIIRIDLLFMYPLLLVVSVRALWAIFYGRK
jgi:hypothetical protein